MLEPGTGRDLALEAITSARLLRQRPAEPDVLAVHRRVSASIVSVQLALPLGIQTAAADDRLPGAVAVTIPVERIRD